MIGVAAAAALAILFSARACWDCGAFQSETGIWPIRFETSLLRAMSVRVDSEFTGWRDVIAISDVTRPAGKCWPEFRRAPEGAAQATFPTQTT